MKLDAVDAKSEKFTGIEMKLFFFLMQLLGFSCITIDLSRPMHLRVMFPTPNQKYKARIYINSRRSTPLLTTLYATLYG